MIADLEAYRLFPADGSPLRPLEAVLDMERIRGLYQSKSNYL